MYKLYTNMLYQSLVDITTSRYVTFVYKKGHDLFSIRRTIYIYSFSLLDNDWQSRHVSQ